MVTILSKSDRSITSGAGAGVLQLPRDVALDAVVAETCDGSRNGEAIAFLPNGMSCGRDRGSSEARRRLSRAGQLVHGGVNVVAADPPR